MSDWRAPLLLAVVPGAGLQRALRELLLQHEALGCEFGSSSVSALGPCPVGSPASLRKKIALAGWQNASPRGLPSSRPNRAQLSTESFPPLLYGEAPYRERALLSAVPRQGPLGARATCILSTEARNGTPLTRFHCFGEGIQRGSAVSELSPAVAVHPLRLLQLQLSAFSAQAFHGECTNVHFGD